MRRIEAEETLLGVVVARFGGHMKPAHARSTVRALQKAASKGKPKRPADPKRLEAAGITVERR